MRERAPGEAVSASAPKMRRPESLRGPCLSAVSSARPLLTAGGQEEQDPGVAMHRQGCPQAQVASQRKD